ncbi:MAG: hypothetical protein K2X38_01395 [Gemmataceae bacterium]|nr:hypothetical protein [Gemmataceae bacterium]
MSRSWDDDPRLRRIRRDDYDDYGSQSPRSGAVTTIGVLGIVYGSIMALFGLCFLFCGIVSFSARNNNFFFAQNAPIMIIVFSIVSLGVSLGHIFGGIYVIHRSNSARIFMLVLAGIDFLFGLLSIAGMIFTFSQPQGFAGNRDNLAMGLIFQVLALLVNWAFSICTFIVLLNGKNAEEFS